MNSTAKCALVTGGSIRIGRAIVENLAAHGYAVAIHCHSSVAEANSLASLIRDKGGRAAVVQADFTDMDAIANVIPQATEALGPLTVLVNNASIFENDAVESLEQARWDTHFDIHLKGPVFLGKAFAAQNSGMHEGLIVNIIDQRVLRPNPLFFSYTLSKSALWAATRTMAQALAPRIRVNAIGPGPALKNDRQTEANFKQQLDYLPLKRGPTLASFGDTIRYFDDTPSITGQMIATDGGQHLFWQSPDIVGIVE